MRRRKSRTSPLKILTTTADDECVVLLMSARLRDSGDEVLPTEHWRTRDGPVEDIRVFCFGLPTDPAHSARPFRPPAGSTEECPVSFDLSLTEEQDAVRDLAGKLALEVLDPAAGEAEKARAIPEPVLRTLTSTGLVAPIDPEYGGGGLPDELSRLIAVEAFAYGDAAIATSLWWTGSVAVLIGTCGTQAQRARYLPRFLYDPLARPGLALYEGYGRAPSEFATTIDAEDGGWRVRGRKTLVPLPTDGMPLLVIGVESGAGGIRAVLLDPRDARLAPSPRLLGLDAAPTADAEFDLLVDEDAVLGGSGADHLLLSRQLAVVRLGIAAAALGSARRAVDYAASYARERMAFGRSISSFQGVAFLVADAHLKVQAAWMELRTILDTLATAGGPGTERDVSRAVAYATTAASEVTRDCVQVLGGHGFLTDHPVERWYRRTAGLAAIDSDPTCQPFTPAL